MNRPRRAMAAHLLILITMLVIAPAASPPAAAAGARDLPLRSLGATDDARLDGVTGAAGRTPTAERVFVVDGGARVRAVLPELARRTRDLAPVVHRASGSAQIFYTIDLSQATPEFITVSATLRAESAHTRIFVEDAQWSTRVDQGDVDAILDAFENDTPSGSIDPATGISSIVESVYGPPSDIDGDGKVHILILDIRDGFNGSGGFIAGYYTSWDQTDQFGSNRADLLYIDCDPADPTGAQVLGTVAHEYQHLVHHAADPDEGRVSPFMNEGLSELSSYLCGYGLRSPGSYLVDTDLPLDRWLSGGAEADYARVALFSCYLYEQFGVGLIGDVFRNPGNGIVGIEQALANAGGRSFEETLADFFVAAAVNDAAADPRYGFQAVSGRALASDTHASFPVSGSGSVQHRGLDIIRFQSSGDLALAVDATSGTGLRARVVGRRPASLVVSDLTIGAETSVEALLGGGFDDYTVLAYTTGVFDAGYAYTAGGSASTITELAYDDGTAEELGVLSPAAFDRGLAVRFSPPGDAMLRTARFFTGDTTTVEVHVWGDAGGFPGAELMPSIPVSPPPGTGWVDVDLTGAGLRADGDDVFVGLIVRSGAADDASVGLDETPPIDDRSYLFDAGAWLEFNRIGLEFADLMIRLEIDETIVAEPPTFSVGVMQDAVFSEVLDVVVAGDDLELATLSGTFSNGELTSSLSFSPVVDRSGLFIAQAAQSIASGSAVIEVSGAAALGAVTHEETLSIVIGDGSQSLPVALGDASLHLPAGATHGGTLVTAQPRGVYPEGPSLESGVPDALVTFSPVALPLAAAATVRFESAIGVIARWTGSGWSALLTHQVDGGLEAQTIALGSFAVLEGASLPAPPAFRVLVPSNPLPAGTAGASIALELATPAPNASVRLVDARGRVVATLHRGPLAAGTHLIPLAGRPAAGVYFVDAVAGSQRVGAKLVVLR